MRRPRPRPYARIRTRPASLPRGRPSHPDDEGHHEPSSKTKRPRQPGRVTRIPATTTQTAITNQGKRESEPTLLSKNASRSLLLRDRARERGGLRPSPLPICLELAL